MIFTADLDRTLIFSRGRLTESPAVVPAEYRLGEPYGFMRPGALAALRQLQKKVLFVPNTMRGVEQARRVVFVGDGSCPYLAAQNGLYLLHNGEPDREWSRRVAAVVHGLPLSLSDGVGQVLSGLPGIQCLSKQYEYLAVFFVEADAFDDEACRQLAEELARLGWSLVRQRKKLYLFPAVIDKGAVLAYVMEREGDDHTVGFGDSGFDLPMLRACGTAWSLAGCELEGGQWGFPIRFSRAPAQAGTEEVLTDLLHAL